ncbi:MAG: hypothetical protein H6622_08555 [Halobacteriovoraceae bacterium]|nr:hypothetical protein [Halobacteriovoraceae bacterium]
MELNKIHDSIDLWKKGRLESSDLAVHFFTTYHSLKYPNKKLQDLIKNNEYETALKNIVFKKVKEKAFHSLLKWNSNKWSFKLLEYIPHPYEVLNFQCNGIRPVSLISQVKLLPILHKKDCLEFFLHDLEHGYMFFHNSELKNMQIDFFKNIAKSLESNLWDDYLKDKVFKEKFYYLISDMNTHKEHYRFYLKAIIEKNDFDRFEFLFE